MPSPEFVFVLCGTLRLHRTTIEITVTKAPPARSGYSFIPEGARLSPNRGVTCDGAYLQVYVGALDMGEGLAELRKMTTHYFIEMAAKIQADTPRITYNGFTPLHMGGDGRPAVDVAF